MRGRIAVSQSSAAAACRQPALQVRAYFGVEGLPECLRQGGDVADGVEEAGDVVLHEVRRGGLRPAGDDGRRAGGLGLGDHDPLALALGGEHQAAGASEQGVEVVLVQVGQEGDGGAEAEGGGEGAEGGLLGAAADDGELGVRWWVVWSTARACSRSATRLWASRRPM